MSQLVLRKKTGEWLLGKLEASLPCGRCSFLPWDRFHFSAFLIPEPIETVFEGEMFQGGLSERFKGGLVQLM